MARLLVVLWIHGGLLAPPSVVAGVAVTDDAGRPVVLSQPARRVVSLAPHLTENIYAVGAGSTLVGVIRFSDFPPAATRLPVVGDASSLDLERIVALRPDLVLAWDSGNPGPALARLEGFGIPVYRSEPRRLTDIAGTLERLGRLTGQGAAAARLAQEFRAGVRRLRERYAQRPPLRVFYQVWHRPLITVNGDHLISDIVALCGGVNVFAGLPVLAPQVTVEAVLAADPEVIVAGSSGTSATVGLDPWLRWEGLAAVRNGALFLIDADRVQRHTPRVLEGAQILCERLERVRGR